ncbi:BolA family protein [Magnetospirillum gryphiswaldense]|uniref:Regulator of penicillin binding proteins and beta lactamase transcription (Morphogene) n=2 Tax=Magnetospirillum gryphiswaldense TaxID=55518 RepID=V6F8W4_MAGGM|nr:BolA family protein [Magnetospirillum gryphiswaldense]AVM74808.1 transcriptional regulator BolA [Magnetospirillum gryphiswaldense MSR-1]AVM78711.1 transcriptional regulator BolA [Magnetospirillum gryphiswaldense]CAM77114.1 BolA-like protein [Magnetospirillum gryphiswaldense MSR-1]CDL01293.1 regulator of penicillin binding proteins and beta lactamase transcription (morphogene) [Magnetospirillum gryphiswaldense MSR-1 v2]
MSVRTAIESKLTQALAPQSLEIIDDSHRHAGHAHRMTEPGHAGQAGETHFKVAVVSAAFAGKSRVERHRMVNTLLAEELAGPVHALQLVTKTPDEA